MNRAIEISVPHHEGTKDTKGSKFILLNFVLFVSFVVKFLSGSLVATTPRQALYSYVSFHQIRLPGIARNVLTGSGAVKHRFRNLAASL
jgi:hypothetical protein